MEQKPDNVIPFPGPKKDKKKEAANRKPTLFFDFENRKVMLSASLGSILLLAALVNTSLNSLTEQETYALRDMSQPNRGIASVQRDPVATESLQRKIASTTGNESAVVGRQPNALEELRFGQLSGSYALTYTDGASSHTKYVKSIQFVNNSDALPSYLNNREKFLWKNRGLLPVQFDTVTKTPVVKSNGQSIETYKLIHNEKPVATADFTLDQFGRFISMKVQKNR